MEADLDSPIESSSNDRCIDKHKEEGKARIEADGKDREAIRTSLEKCIDPLDPDKHPEGILNIVTGQYGNSFIGMSKIGEFCQK